MVFTFKMSASCRDAFQLKKSKVKILQIGICTNILENYQWDNKGI